MKSRVISTNKAEVLANIITLVGAKKQIEALPQKLRDADDLFLPIRKELYKQVKKVPAMLNWYFNERKLENFDPKGKDDRYTIKEVLLRMGMIRHYYEDAQKEASQLVFDMKDEDTIDQINHMKMDIEILRSFINQEGNDGVRAHKFSIELFLDSCIATNPEAYHSHQITLTYQPYMDEFLSAQEKMYKEVYDLGQKCRCLSDDIESNINKMRTTGKVIENWPEVEPLVLQMYGEEDSKSAPEVPLGNIINRHLLQLTDQSGATA
tara:strand:- start:1 stop:795 length:795 start_codon:yes stop_codon:yes gene_type:complete